MSNTYDNPHVEEHVDDRPAMEEHIAVQKNASIEVGLEVSRLLDMIKQSLPYTVKGSMQYTLDSVVFALNKGCLELIAIDGRTAIRSVYKNIKSNEDVTKSFGHFGVKELKALSSFLRTVGKKEHVFLSLVNDRLDVSVGKSKISLSKAEGHYVKYENLFGDENDKGVETPNAFRIDLSAGGIETLSKANKTFKKVCKDANQKVVVRHEGNAFFMHYIAGQDYRKNEGEQAEYEKFSTIPATKVAYKGVRASEQEVSRFGINIELFERMQTSFRDIERDADVFMIKDVELSPIYFKASNRYVDRVVAVMPMKIDTNK